MQKTKKTNAHRQTYTQKTVRFQDFGEKKSKITKFKSKTIRLPPPPPPKTTTIRVRDDQETEPLIASKVHPLVSIACILPNRMPKAVRIMFTVRSTVRIVLNLPFMIQAESLMTRLIVHNHILGRGFFGCRSILYYYRHRHTRYRCIKNE